MAYCYNGYTNTLKLSVYLPPTQLIYVTGLVKGVLYTHLVLQLWTGIISLVSKLLSWNPLPYKCNYSKVMPPNFKAVDQTEVELHILKGENSDECIRPFS